MKKVLHTFKKYSPRSSVRTSLAIESYLVAELVFGILLAALGSGGRAFVGHAAHLEVHNTRPPKAPQCVLQPQEVHCAPTHRAHYMYQYRTLNARIRIKFIRCTTIVIVLTEARLIINEHTARRKVILCRQKRLTRE